jgi:hypothetical protein
MRRTALNRATGVGFTVLDRCWWLWPLWSVGAVTPGPRVVWVKRSLSEALTRNPSLLNHEAVHIQQAREMGWKYLPTYFWKMVTCGFRRHHHPMELDAYIRQHVQDVRIISR